MNAPLQEPLHADEVINAAQRSSANRIFGFSEFAGAVVDGDFDDF